MNPTIQTKGNRFINLTQPESYPFNIEEIAHALSNICRFTGHTSHFYSVAQHCVFCSKIVRIEDAMEALLHDATEAYLGDVSSPLKQFLPEYKRFEERMDLAIRTHFKLPSNMTMSVKTADLICLATERKHLMPSNTDAEEWDILKGVYVLPSEYIKYMSPNDAKLEFLNRFYALEKIRKDNGRA